MKEQRFDKIAMVSRRLKEWRITLRIDILTLFPAMFAPMSESIMKRACDKGFVDMHITNIRDYAEDKHSTTDDRLYGGGAGMVMKPEPLFAAIEDCKLAADKTVRVVMTSPAGELFSQKKAQELSQADQVIFVCGHYEGVDQRVEDTYATDVLSIGDYVLTGGELPAMIMADSVVRLIPGVLGDDASSEEESFQDGLLEYPQYTRPPIFREMEVPPVLLSGNHEDIRRWRRTQSLARTYQRRRELLSHAMLTPEDVSVLAEIKKNMARPFRLWVALLHYPVYNKKKEIVNTSLTNLDLHDISRAAATYDLAGFFIVQPAEGQRELISTLLGHWKKGFGARYNPHRHQALEKTCLVSTLEDAITAIGEPKLIATSAKANPDMVDYAEMRRIMTEEGGDYLLLLGTGWGLTDELMAASSFILRPIYGVGEYNHLSVRSAASIIFDRLLGEK